MADIDDAVPIEGVISVKQEARANLAAVRGRINGLPDSADPDGNETTPHLGKAVVVGTAGAVPAGPSDTVHFGGARVREGRPDPVPVTGNITLDDDDHQGRLLTVNSASEITITLAPASIMDGFRATVVRYGTGDVAFSCADGLTLRHPDGHTRIYRRYDAVVVQRLGDDVLLLGATKA